MGGADKKWKGNFWFCFAASDYEKSNFILTLLVALYLRLCDETRRFLSVFGGSLKLCDFDRVQW